MKMMMQKILRLLARLVFKKYKPEIIGITGSVGKTSTKEAVFTVLKSSFNVRKSEKNYNNEIGVPLAILGMDSPKKSFWGWLVLFFKAIKILLVRDQGYPQVLVLEMAADKPGDIKYLTSIVQPTIGIVTAVAPVHLEAFKTIETIAREKSVLIRNLSSRGAAILNADDELVYTMKDLSKSPIIFYGFSEKAEVKVIEFTVNYNFTKNEGVEGGMHFKIEYGGNVVPFFLPEVLGKHQIYAALAAIAVGIHYKMNLIKISETLKKYQSPAGRMRVIQGIKNSFIIDDTYNSSPLSCQAALDTLQDIPQKGKKFVVLGEMLELGKYSEEAHFMIGEKLGKMGFDFLVGAGEKARGILMGAQKSGMAKEKIFYFSESAVIGQFLKDKIEKDDIILIKGSQGVRMERVVRDLMAEPERAKELLVRQGKEWENKL